jgi:lipoprotein
MTTRIPSRHTILAAAILALLAGCGSGQDDSATRTKTTANSLVTAGSSSAQAINGALAPSSKAASSTQAAIDKRSISSDLLATLLLQGTTWDGQTPEYRVWPAWPWRGTANKGQVDTDALAHTPPVQGGQWLQQVDEASRHYRYRQASWLQDSRVNGFSYPTLDTGLDLNMVSEGSYQENFHGSQYLVYSRDTTLNLGNQAQVRVGGTGNGRSGEDAASDGQILLLDAVTRPVAITSGRRIPLNQSLAEWRNAQGDSVKLVPMAGPAKGQVRLCLDQQVQNLKRLSCTLWQVPADWTNMSALPTYQGMRVVDERDDRQQTWQSSTHYPAYKAATVSSRGVRGDVLAGVLVNYVDTVPALIGPVYQGWSAVPWNGPGPGGKPLPRDNVVPTVPDIEGWSSIQPPDQADPGNPHYTYEFKNFLSHDSRHLLPDYVFTSQTITLGMDVHMGRYFEGYRDMTFFTSGRFLYSVDGEATPGRPLLTLSTQASFTTGDPASAVSPLRSAGSYTLRAGEVVPFKQVLQHWQDDKGNQATLKVLKGKAKDEFRLCLDQQLPAIKRLSCSHWRIPAGWRLDISPEFKGISVADDRSAVGGSGTLYWQTRPEASRDMKSMKTLQRKALIRQKALQQR